MDRMTDGGDRRIGMSCELLRNGTNQRRRYSRLVALDIDDNLLGGPATQGRHFGNSIGAGSVILARHHRGVAMAADSLEDPVVIVATLTSAAPLRARDRRRPNHRPAGNVAVPCQAPRRDVSAG